MKYAELGEGISVRALHGMPGGFEPGITRGEVAAAAEDPTRMSCMLRIVRSTGTFSRRKTGVLNDIRQFTSIEDTDFSLVPAPASGCSS